jgi:hypothetical protein
MTSAVNSVVNASSVTHLFKNIVKPVIGAGLAAALALLAACESTPLTPPVTETRQAPGALAAGAGPLWTRQLIAGRFNCELNNQVDIKMGDGQRHIDLTWKGKVYVMLPVATSTGALRFEDRDSGMVWIQIPAKSMLLNSKRGEQVANECKV